MYSRIEALSTKEIWLMMIVAGSLAQALKSGGAELSAKYSGCRIDKGFNEAMGLITTA